MMKMMVIPIMTDSVGALGGCLFLCRTFSVASHLRESPFTIGDKGLELLPSSAVPSTK